MSFCFACVIGSSTRLLSRLALCCVIVYCCFLADKLTSSQDPLSASTSNGDSDFEKKPVTLPIPQTNNPEAFQKPLLSLSIAFRLQTHPWSPHPFSTVRCHPAPASRTIPSCPSSLFPRRPYLWTTLCHRTDLIGAYYQGLRANLLIYPTWRLPPRFTESNYLQHRCIVGRVRKLLPLFEVMALFLSLIYWSWFATKKDVYITHLQDSTLEADCLPFRQVSLVIPHGVRKIFPSLLFWFRALVLDLGIFKD